jgi:FtsH-binding integral membrane protein
MKPPPPVTKALPALGIGATLAQPPPRLPGGYFQLVMNGAETFRVTAVVSALLGALLVLGSWDGLYDRLDLPQALPALGPQMGGIALLALASLQWSAGTTEALRRPVALAGAFFYLGSAALIAGWLILRDKIDLEVGDTGWAILIVTAVVLAGLGAALARSARS